MVYTLNYKDSFNEIKSMDTATDIDLVLSKDGLPYDFNSIKDNLITVKIANQNGYIKDLPIDISEYTSDEKTSGTFNLNLDDDFMSEFPPDVYYIEVWVNTTNNSRIIFPSDNSSVPFTIDPNIENSSSSIPMITFYQVKQDLESTKRLVFNHEAQVEKYINTLNDTKDNITNDINSKINNYYKYSNNIKDTLDSLNTKVFNESDDINNKIQDVSNNVSEATSEVTHAGKDVKSSVEAIITSAKSNINYDIDTNSAIALVNSGASKAESYVTDTINDAQNRLSNTFNDIKNNVSNLVKNGTDQINTAAGSAANKVNTLSNHINDKASSAVTNITSTENSVNNNFSSYTTSFDNQISTAKNSFNNYISNTDNKYSNLNNSISNIKDTISNKANSAYSNMDSLEAINTSQMVSVAVNDFNKSTGTNNTIPGSLKNLSLVTNDLRVSTSNLQSNINKDNSLINGISASTSLITNNVNRLKSMKDSITSINSSVSTNSNNINSLSSGYDKYLQDAKSYTDSKIKDASKGNNSSGSVNDNQNINLVPREFTNEYKDWVDGIRTVTIHFEAGKSYWLSCNVLSGYGRDFIFGGEDDLDPIDNHTYTTPGHLYIVHWTPNKTGDVAIGVEDSNGSCDFKNLCVTQSNDYIPFKMAEMNRNLTLGQDLYKPNLLPVTEYKDTVDDDNYRIFNIPVKKGKTYWISGYFNIIEGTELRITAPNGSDMESILTDNSYKDHYAGNFDYNNLFIYTWKSDKTGNLPIGFTIPGLGKTKIDMTNLCITESDDYVPFELAQSTRENIQSVFNTFINNK